MKVYTKHQGYSHTYTIKKFSHLTAASCKFMIEENGVKRETSVKDYFRETAKKTSVPIELLFVKPNQRFNRLLSPFQTSQMIKVGAASLADS